MFDKLPYEIQDLIFQYSSLESAVPLSRTCRALHDRWNSLEDLQREKVLARVPWFSLDESDGPKSWDACAVAIVTRTGDCIKGQKGWEYVTKENSMEVLLGENRNAQDLSPVDIESLDEAHVISVDGKFPPDNFPSSKKTLVGTSSGLGPMSLLAENDDYFHCHFLEEELKEHHTIVSKALCPKVQGMYIVDIRDVGELLGFTTKVSLLPGNQGALIVSYEVENFHEDENDYQVAKLFHLPGGQSLPFMNDDLLDSGTVCTQLGPSLSLEDFNFLVYYPKTPNNFNMSYNGYFYVMVLHDQWIRVWADLDNVDEEDNVRLSHNTNVPMMQCMSHSPDINKHKRCLNDRFFILQPVSVPHTNSIADLKTGKTYSTGPVEETREGARFIKCTTPYFDKTDPTAPRFFTWMHDRYPPVPGLMDGTWRNN